MTRSSAADGGAQAAWRGLLDLLRGADTSFLDWDQAGELQPVDVAEGYRYLLHLLRYGVDFMVESDPQRPRFVEMANEVTKVFGDNRDTRYHYTHIDGGDTYRIVGNRGDACYLSFQSHRGPDRGSPAQRTTDNLNMTRIDFGPTGDFDILVGRDRVDGDWLRLDDDATCVISREYYLDPVNDQRARFEIQPLSRPGPPPPLTVASMADRLTALTAFIASAQQMGGPPPVKEWNVYQEPWRFSGDIPAWGTPDNTYARCYFRLADDEALVITGQTVPCAYWGLQLWNIYTQTLDYRDHTVSLNGRELAVDSAGGFEVVLAHEDPGVPNWLDTAGHHIGAVFVRWLCAEQQPSRPVARVVKLAEVR